MWKKQLEISSSFDWDKALFDKVAENAIRLGAGAFEALELLYKPMLHYTFQRSQQQEGPLFIGVTGPQGSGKSTLVAFLTTALNGLGVKTVGLSVDDFYLPREDQIRFAEAHANVTCFQQRGYPGTHDIELGNAVFQKLLGPTGEVRVPRYDKSAHNGLGDRFLQEHWASVTLPVQVILLEGWMLGFQSLSAGDWPEVDAKLSAYESWQQRFMEEWLLYPENFQFVYQWRGEAEEKMRRSTGRGLSDAEIRSYVDQFIPAYEIYYPPLRKRLEQTPGSIIIDIDQKRLPL